MRRLWLLLVFIFSAYNFYGQTETLPVEIFVGTENVNPAQKTIIIYLTAIDAVWGGKDVSSTQINYYLTDEFDYLAYTVPVNNNNQIYWAGLDFVLSQTYQGYYPIFGYGLYKVTTNESNAYFYLDYRDDRFGNYSQYSPVTFGHDQDIWIKYDDAANKFYLKSGGSFEWGDPLINGETLNIWDIKQKGSPGTERFPLYLTISEQNGHPKLTWNEFNDESSLDKYWIYKKKEEVYFTKILETDSLSWVDIDEEIVSCPYVANEILAKYYVSAHLINGQNSLPGNTVKARIEGAPQLKQMNSGKSLKSGNVGQFSLIQNYPNPFNPSTKIKFVLPVSAVVTVRVFNAIGEEVAELVNREYTEGIHEAVFGSESVSGSLTSGVYFYTIDAKGSDGSTFRSVNKMMLLK